MSDTINIEIREPHHIKLIENRTVKQEVATAKAILASKSGQEFDGITAMRMFEKEFGIYADWHFFTAVMDEMARDGLAICTVPFGYTKYRIN